MSSVESSVRATCRNTVSSALHIDGPLNAREAWKVVDAAPADAGTGCDGGSDDDKDTYVEVEAR